MTDEQKQKIAREYAIERRELEENEGGDLERDVFMFVDCLDARDEEVRIAENDRDIIEAKLIGREDENKVLREALEKIIKADQVLYQERRNERMVEIANEALQHTSKKEVNE